MRRLICAILLACCTAAVAATLPPEQEQRYQALIAELRCLVCQNQNIAESNAPLAEDLRRQVQDMILRGASDAEIKRYLTDRYGDFVLYRPPLKRSTWLLWTGPFLLLLMGLLIALRLFRRKPAPPQPLTPADAEALQRALGADGRERRP